MIATASGGGSGEIIGGSRTVADGSNNELKKPSVPRKRKLRQPGQGFQSEAGPSDDPTLHQGRKRAAPHIEGQWSTHVYIEALAPKTLLHTLQDVVANTSEILQGLGISKIYSLIGEKTPKSASTKETLHLSLSRPIQLWTGQRAEFVSALRSTVSKTRPFEFSLTGWAYLTNNEKTRSFLVCEVGFGHEELAALTTSTNAVLKAKHLPTYYAEPRFHISIAWWLPSDDLDASEAIDKLNSEHGRNIRKHTLSTNEVHVKIGKDVTSIALLA